MRIGAIGNIYPNYIYNTNTVSANSMNKLSRISDNVLDKKVDYSETTAQENQNPLKKGETLDFAGVLARQMQQSQNRAAKVLPNGLKPAEDQEKTEEVKSQETKANTNTQEAKVNTVAEDTNVNPDAENAANGNNASVTQMQRAIQAYEMFMTA